MYFNKLSKINNSLISVLSIPIIFKVETRYIIQSLQKHFGTHPHNNPSFPRFFRQKMRSQKHVFSELAEISGSIFEKKAKNRRIGKRATQKEDKPRRTNQS